MLGAYDSNVSCCFPPAFGILVLLVRFQKSCRVDSHFWLMELSKFSPSKRPVDTLLFMNPAGDSISRIQISP